VQLATGLQSSPVPWPKHSFKSKKGKQQTNEGGEKEEKGEDEEEKKKKERKVPVQVTPVPLNPESQVQKKDPGVLVQVA